MADEAIREDEAGMIANPSRLALFLDCLNENRTHL
jgi:hypothetical protein